jgi:orotidine-5'-phosphate decarboxylase
MLRLPFSLPVMAAACTCAEQHGNRMMCPFLFTHRELSSAQDKQQQQQQEQQVAGGCYADVQQLQSHWQELDASRKVMYAQMAVLTRCAVQQQIFITLEPQLVVTWGYSQCRGS